MDTSSKWLTALILMNCAEKMVLQHIRDNISGSLDPHQCDFSDRSTALHFFTQKGKLNTLSLSSTLWNRMLNFLTSTRSDRKHPDSSATTLKPPLVPSTEHQRHRWQETVCCHLTTDAEVFAAVPPNYRAASSTLLIIDTPNSKFVCFDVNSLLCSTRKPQLKFVLQLLL